MYTHTQSEALFEQAKAHIPGGVNSPVRAFKGVGGTPVFFERGEGAYVFDVDGQQYIDYVGSWGPLILGHCDERIKAAVVEALQRGISFGAPTAIETALAQTIQNAMPSLERVRFVSSGTEATMTAVRLARGFTGKSKIIKFKGCYHGHSDSLLVNSGSGLLTLGIPASPGILPSTAEHTLVVDFNDIAATKALFKAHAKDIAGVIIEPIAGNMGFIQPTLEFLQELKSLCAESGALLIFDEVMTGFRVAHGGAQAHFGIHPDLTTLGKIIGGGMPVGAIGGRQEVMAQLAPEGPVYQAGTLSGNPLAMAAGMATLNALEAPGFYDQLGQITQHLMTGLKQAADTAKVPLCVDALGGMFGFCFTAQSRIQTLDDVTASNDAQFRAFFHHMLDQGIYFAPSRFEAGFVSIRHTLEDINRTVEAAHRAFQHVASLTH